MVVSVVVVLFLSFISLSGVYASSDEEGEERKREQQTYAEMLGMMEKQSGASRRTVTSSQILAGVGAGALTWWGGLGTMIEGNDRNNSPLAFTGLGIALSTPIVVPVVVSGIGYSMTNSWHLPITFVGGLIGTGATLLVRGPLGLLLLSPIGATLGSVVAYRSAGYAPRPRGGELSQGTMGQMTGSSAPMVMPMGDPSTEEWGLGVGWSGRF